MEIQTEMCNMSRNVAYQKKMFMWLFNYCRRSGDTPLPKRHYRSIKSYPVKKYITGELLYSSVQSVVNPTELYLLLRVWQSVNRGHKYPSNKEQSLLSWHTVLCAAFNKEYTFLDERDSVRPPPIYSLLPPCCFFVFLHSHLMYC